MADHLVVERDVEPAWVPVGARIALAAFGKLGGPADSIVGLRCDAVRLVDVCGRELARAGELAYVGVGGRYSDEEFSKLMFVVRAVARTLGLVHGLAAARAQR